ncbi:MAG: acetylesterase [Oscillospiraceae bacterium]|jgi:enterochelin esterase-like enzyme|nr:acetylesterase [Oscillospiraceae bacterium]
MALIHANFFAPSLMRTVDIDVLIPADPMFSFGAPPEYKAMYLLHGFMGSHVDWHLNVNLSELSQMTNMAIIMPSGDNAFYVDMEPATMRYSKFIGEDLVNFTRTLLPISGKREDTLLAGLSMGGFGALYNGLKYYKTFGHIIALSSAIVTYEAKYSTADANPLGVNRAYFSTVFGNLDELDSSDKNLDILSEHTLAAAKAEALPLDVFFACGENDSLVQANRLLHRHMKKIGFEHVYEEAPGTHEWSFWDKFLRRGVERLYPLPKIDGAMMPFWREKPNEPIDLE